MSGAQQVSFMNQRSFGPPPPPAVGSAYEGGFFAGQISVAGNGVASHNLVIGPLSTAQSTGAWKTAATTTSGTDSVIDGPTNTAVMIAAGAAAHPCAQFCDNLVTGGFSDWYMPARNELAVCYFNLKPTTALNSTASGINANAVPARAGNYTSGTPAQTTAAVFQEGGAQAFTAAVYWASNQMSATAGGDQNFTTGYQFHFYSKTSLFRVRAVRRVAV